LTSFKPDKPKTADRGKAAERAVNDYLVKFAQDRLHFDWMRYPDAKSAGGRMKAMPADFEFCMPGAHGLLEIKETAHAFRLSKSKVPQLAKLRLRTFAGGKCVLVVYHSVNKEWRCVDSNLLDPAASSWDLSLFTPYERLDSAMAWLHNLYHAQTQHLR
jgi:hypothetical protein